MDFVILRQLNFLVMIRLKRQVKAFLEHSLMNRGLLLEGAAGVIVSIRGNHALRIQEVEIIMENLGNKTSGRGFINFGVSIDEEQIGLKVVVLVTEAWKSL